MKRTIALRVAFGGLLAAAAVVLSFLENLLPALPFLPPGAKAGFANIVIMFALQVSGGPAALCVAFLKSVFVLVTRGPTAFIMSLLGGLTATLVMWLCVRYRASFIATGICGAVTHNTAQLFCAMVLTGTPGLIVYYPLLLLFATLAGIVTGLLLNFTFPPLYKAAKTFTPISSERG